VLDLYEEFLDQNLECAIRMIKISGLDQISRRLGEAQEALAALDDAIGLRRAFPPRRRSSLRRRARATLAMTILPETGDRPESGRAKSFMAGRGGFEMARVGLDN
jgi:hypothetical protein